MTMTREQFYEFLEKKGHVEKATTYEHHLHVKNKKETMYKQYLELKKRGEL